MQTVIGYRLSPQQRQLWQQQPSAISSGAQCMIKLTGPLRAEALHAAVADVVEQHEILRTSFQRQPGMRTPVQVICEEPALRVSLRLLSDQSHELALSLPALCADYTTLSLLIHELAARYDRRIGVEAASREFLQYADFCEWQNELREGEYAAAGREFWASRQAIIDNPLRLPFETTEVSLSEPERLSFTFDQETMSALDELSVSHAISASAILLACWQLLLWRLSGQESFQVNCLFDLRHYDELDGALGLFSRSLPLVCRLDDEQTLLSLVHEVEEHCARLSEWQEYYDYDGEVESSSEQISFEYCERTGRHVCVDGLKWEVLDQRSEIQRAKLGLRCERVNGEFKAEISYNAEVYAKSDIEWLIERMQTLVAGAVAQPTKKTGEVAIVPERERRYLIEELSSTSEELLREDQSIVNLFEAAADKYPDRLAIVCSGEQLSYGELNRRANQLARFLRRRGVAADVNVALFVERKAHAFVALLAVLKAGGAFVPMNIEQPRDRLARQLADMQAPLVLTEESLLEELPEFDGTVICLDTAARWWEHESGADLPATGFPENVAYIIYTSGSTGTPKGVAVTRRNLLNYTRYICHRLQLETDDRPLSFATVSTLAADLGHTSIFPALVTGGCLHVIDYEVATNAQSFTAYLEEHPIDVLKIVPSHLSALLSESGGLPRRWLVLGGEALSRQLVERLNRTAKTCRIINHYGPTETTVGCLTCDVVELPERCATAPIGHPIANTQVYVLDTHGRLVPFGAAGELYIGGDGVARGYLNQPAQTAERFIPDSFSGKAGARLYRTGDLVQRSRNGAVEFLGRVDNQVKIRGHRIELGEIEAALRQHPQVREVTVLAASDEREHKRLVAYLVPSGKPAPTTIELHTFLETKLPAYMWPSIFVLLDEMPLTANGKLDRRALPAPEAARVLDAARSFEGPRSDVERTLAEIWKQVLGVAEIGIHDNFFELGGDSIISIQIIARANQKGIRLLPKQLFQNQTIAKLAAVADTTGAPVEAEQGIVIGSLPLTPVQRWFFEQNIAEPHHWNQSLLLELKEPVDATLLEMAVEHLIRHHDALRLRFTKEKTDWQQFNAALPAKAPFERVDLSALSNIETPTVIEQRAAEEQAGIDLSAGALMRVVLFDCGASEPSRLLLVIHHLAVDGISWRVLLSDLQTACAQLARGENVQLPLKTTSFKRWARQLAEHAQAPGTVAELPFWLKQFATAGRLPRDKEDGENTVASAETFVTELTIDETRALLHDLPAKFHTQINDSLIAALAQTLSRWSNTGMSLIELEGHGREEIDESIDVSLTVGWFTTHFPVAVNLETATTPGDALRIVKEQLRRIPRKGFGYGLLRYLNDNAEIAAQMSSAPSPEVSFNYLGQLDQILPESAMFRLAKENPGPPRSPSAKRPFLLEVGASVTAERMRVTWTYSRDTHHRATIERLAAYFNESLRSLLAYATLADAACLTPSDFPLAGLEQAELDELTQGEPLVADIYPLSSVQQGLLFHSLYAPEGGLYFEQKTCLLRGRLNTGAFAAACREVVNRHPILRTSFRWQHLDEPLQVVHQRVEAPWSELDWSGLDRREQEQRLQQFLKDDRARPFDLAAAPLMRMALIKLSDTTHRFIWSHHHLLLDGWTMPILFEEVFVCYEALRRGRRPSLPETRPYRDYVAWLKQQDMSEAEAYWRKALCGLKAPTSPARRLGSGKSNPEAEIYEQQELHLSTLTSANVREFARQHQLTINTLVQGMWALLLSHHSRCSDVVFGATVSGRPPSLIGVERMVGLFINTLPVRVSVRSGEKLLEWLDQLQTQQVEMRQYEFTPLIKLQEWSDVAHGMPLFDHILVFDNYPITNSAVLPDGPPAPDESFTFEEFEAFEKTNYAILVQAGMGEQLTFRILHDRQLVEPQTVARILRHFEMLIESAVTRPTTTIKNMLDMLSEFDSEQEAAQRQTRLAAKFKKFGEVQPKVITAAANEV